MAKSPSVQAHEFDGDWYVGWVEGFARLRGDKIQIAYGYPWLECAAAIGEFTGKLVGGDVYQGKWHEHALRAQRKWHGTATLRLIEDGPARRTRRLVGLDANPQRWPLALGHRDLTGPMHCRFVSVVSHFVVPF